MMFVGGRRGDGDLAVTLSDRYATANSFIFLP
jgi:hypothetical protein